MVSEPINGIYNSTAELYCQAILSLEVVKDPYALAILLKRAIFYDR
jgi:hypothetical protein